MDMANTYWNHKGKHQADYDRLSELVPNMGTCDTFGGELIRAVGRLYYDAYNNGFCNNTSGALNFLSESSWVADKEWSHVYNLLSEKVNTGGYSDLCEATQEGLELLANLAIEWVLANPEEAMQPTDDLFDYQEEDYQEEEDDDEYEYCEDDDDEWYCEEYDECY